jgi:tRNA-specific 2-thiouridylase
MGKRVIAAMSGGVDSSAAAALLKEQGYDVIGITLNVWPSEEGELRCTKTCCSITDVDDARAVCYKLDIPHYVLNMRDFFKENVIDYFISEYMKGRTPNPCIACNAQVKFRALMQKAEALGADYVATGHYGVIEKNSNDEYCLRRSSDIKKDQSYVLYMLGQQQLSHLLLPCGGYQKSEIRAIAEKYGLPTYHKADSQDLCFVGAEGYSGFIKQNCGNLAVPGNVIDRDGNVIGRHEGVYNFTIGQHKGLGKYSSEKLFVTDIDADTATVNVGYNEDLFKDAMLVEDMSYMISDGIKDGRHLMVKIRYNATETPSTVYRLDDNRFKVVFDSPQRAITPGQAAVFYSDDIVLGGGTIIGAAQK